MIYRYGYIALFLSLFLSVHSPAIEEDIDKLPTVTQPFLDVSAARFKQLRRQSALRCRISSSKHLCVQTAAAGMQHFHVVALVS